MNLSCNHKLTQITFILVGLIPQGIIAKIFFLTRFEEKKLSVQLTDQIKKLYKNVFINQMLFHIQLCLQGRT